jgi:hypothetical protein
MQPQASSMQRIAVAVMVAACGGEAPGPAPPPQPPSQLLPSASPEPVVEREPEPEPIAIAGSAGDLDARAIEGAIRPHAGELQQCWDARPSEPVHAHAVPTIEFTIGADGRVTTVTIDGFGKQVDDCVARVIETTRFPASHGVTRVSYPFVFSTR